MAGLNNNGLDDPVVVDACPSFALGQRSYGPPDQLQFTEAARLVNVDVRDGTATTRRGTEALGAALPGRVQGLCWYDTPAQEYAVAAAGGALWKWDGTTWGACSSYASANTEGQIALAQLVDRLFIADGVSHLQVWDGSLLLDLGTGGNTQPPVGSLLLSAQNRLWLAGVASVPDGLYASQLLEGSVWDATTLMIRIGGGEGDPITGLAEWDDYQVVVFKRSSIYIVRADPSQTHGADAEHSLANATVTKISDTVGCVAPRSIARVGNDVWFLAEGGVYSIGRVLAQTQRELKQAVSGPVQDVLETVNWAAAQEAAAVYWDNYYLLALPQGASTEPTLVLAYHTARQCWAGTWQGWQPLCWAVARERGEERLIFGQSSGAVWRWLEYVAPEHEVERTYEDAGTPVTTEVVTRAMFFGEPVATKNALTLRVEFHGSRTVAHVAGCRDEQAPEVMAERLSTEAGELRLTFTLPAVLPTAGLKRRALGAQHLAPFRTLQVRVRSASGKLALRTVLGAAFVNTLALEE